jgi:hypothetical protein
MADATIAPPSEKKARIYEAAAAAASPSAAHEVESEPFIVCSACHELPVPPTSLPCQHVMCVPCAKSLTERLCPLCRAAFSSEHEHKPSPPLLAAIRSLYPEHVARVEHEVRAAMAAAEAERALFVVLVRAEIDQLLRVAETQGAYCVSNKQLLGRLVAAGIVKHSLPNEDLGPIIDAAVDGNEFEYIERIVRPDWRSFDEKLQNTDWAESKRVLHRTFRRSTIVRAARLPQHFGSALRGGRWEVLCTESCFANGANIYYAHLAERLVAAGNAAVASIDSNHHADFIQRHAALAAFATLFPRRLPQINMTTSRAILYGRKLKPSRHCEHCPGKTKLCGCSHGCALSEGCTCYPNSQ